MAFNQLLIIPGPQAEREPMEEQYPVMSFNLPIKTGKSLKVRDFPPVLQFTAMMAKNE